MRKFIIKMVIFLMIVTVAFFDYRLISMKDGKILFANWHRLTSWSEVQDQVVDASLAEIYPSRISRRSQGQDEIHHLVIYTNNHFYNIKANDLELERITQLMRIEQVEVVEIMPVEAWFYGLLVVLLIVFPVMRKVE